MAGYLLSIPGGQLRGEAAPRSGGDRCLFVEYNSVTLLLEFLQWSEDPGPGRVDYFNVMGAEQPVQWFIRAMVVLFARSFLNTIFSRLRLVWSG